MPEDGEEARLPESSARHVRLIALILFLTVVVAEIVDLQFNWVVQQSTETLGERAAAFGNVFSFMGLAAFAFQLVFTSRIHRVLGVGFAMRVLPTFVLVMSAVVALGTLVGPLAPLLVVGLLKVGDNGLRYSLDHATRELLFVPVPVRHRAAAKARVEVFVHRFARGAGAVLLLSVTFGLVEVLETAWFVLALALAWLVLTFWAKRHYIQALRSGLGLRREGLRDNDATWLDPNDVNTLEVLVESLGSADPALVVNSMDLLKAHGRARLVPPVLLHHEDASVRRRTLEALVEARRRDALPLIEQRLTDADGDVRVAAVRAMARLTMRERVDLMRPRLASADPRVRSAAIGCLADHEDPEVVEEALASLDALMGDEMPSSRAEAARALAQLDEPVLQERLIRLLYDQDPGAVRAAIEAIRQRLRRASAGGAGVNPLYAPILIALLRNRRLKHDARETLAAYGVRVLPALRHFMNDEGEQIWVRRAIPKTVALLDSPEAVDVLYDGLEHNQDRFLRRKLVEALLDLRHLRQDGDRLARQIRVECERCADSLVVLLGLSRPGQYELLGSFWQWQQLDPPTFLQRLVDERRLDHLRNLRRLVTLCRDRGGELGLEQALERALDSDRRQRSRALECLDNVLGEPERRLVMPLIDDLQLDERLALLERQFDVRTLDFEGTLHLLIQRGLRQPDFAVVGSAALADGFRVGLESVRRVGRQLERRGPRDLFGETALWLGARETLAG